MTFPAVSRTVIVEAALGGTWVDISADVDTGGQEDSLGIEITNRGRTAEASTVGPTTARLGLANADGKYSPRNPTGTYTGLLKRNTRLRALVRTIQDLFTRTVSNGWGTTPDSHPWTTLAVSSDYNVTGTAATHTTTSGAAERISYLADTAAWTHTEVTVTASLNRVDSMPSPSSCSYNILLRGQSTSTFHYAQITVANTGGVALALQRRVAGVSTVLASSATGFVAGTAVRIKAVVEGQTIRAVAWQPSLSSEPVDWMLSVDDPLMAPTGWVGIRSTSPAGDAVTRVFSYDDLEVRIPRLSVEIPSWPTEWSIAGKDAYTQLEPAGLLRRLSQGSEPLQSALFRGFLLNTPGSLQAYWPCEDDSDADAFASAVVTGVAPMSYTGTPTIAGFSEFPCSNPLPVTTADSRWVGVVPGYAPGTQPAMTLRFLAHIPAGTTPNTILASLQTTGSLQRWDIYYRGGSGDLSVSAVSALGTTLYTGSTVAFGLNDQLVQIDLALKDNLAGGTDLVLETFDVTTGATTATTATPSGSINTATVVMINPTFACVGVAVGHVGVQASGVSLIGSADMLSDELRAWLGERSARRAARLCGEEGISLDVVGDPDASAMMGAQRTQTFLALLQECAEADLGLLYEPLSTLGLAFRTAGSFYNQAATLALNYTTGDLAPPFAPTPRDRDTRNTITVQRTGGSKARYVETTGPLSALPPPNGVGPYPESATVNVAYDDLLTHQAVWRAHRGTVDEDGFPRLPLDLNAPGLGNLGMMADIGHRITVDAANPAFVYDQVSQIVLGYSEQISDFHHQVTLAGSPESPYHVWELENATYGRLDTAGSVLAVAIGTGDTALSVATTSGPKWTTAGGDLPMPLMLSDSEQVSATAIANETFTFVAAGTAAQANNASVSPGLPTGHTTGDLLLILAAIHNSGTGSPVAPAGYVTLFDGGHIKLFGKIDNGAESAPTVTFTGGVAGPTGAQMAAFRGKLYNVASPVLNAGQRGKSNPSAQDVAYPPLALLSEQIEPSDNCIGMVIAWKHNNWTSAAAAPGMTKIGEYTTFQSSIGQGVTWSYVIQTSATDIAANSVTITGGASDISLGAVIGIRSDRQAFTVTRAGNGVVRSHAAGAAVELYYQTALAL